MKKEYYTREQVIRACKGSGGILSNVAKALKCDRSTVADYRDRYKTVEKALKQERENIIDKAECIIFEGLESDDEKIRKQTAEYISNRLGKDRGYYEKKGLEHELPKEPIRIKFVRHKTKALEYTKEHKKELEDKDNNV